MRWRLKLIGLASLLVGSLASSETQTLSQRYKAAADRITQAALKDTTAHERLGRLTDTFGPRFSGTENLDRAIDWILAEMQKDGLDHVHGEPVSVPHWVRGVESAELISPRHRKLPMLGLGGSIATLPGGISAEVLVVRAFDDLKAHAEQARGKIVLFDVPFTDYREVVPYRFIGASAAARVGAVASLLRSLGPVSLQTPHTGAMGYDEDAPKIPSAAITLEDAAMLHRMQDRGEHIVVKLEMNAQLLPDASSRNVVAELTGTELPDEVVIISGHIDSWDVGQGALDDGGGSLAAWEAVRLLKQLNLRPRRTVRVVLWTNEENGIHGGLAYRDAHAKELEKHVAAIESDNGVSRPVGFRITGGPGALELAKSIGPLLAPLSADTIVEGGPEADVSPMVARGVPGVSLSVDGSKYFWYHHTDADTFDKVNPQELAQCVAAMAVMAYTLADMHEVLPRGPLGKTP